MKLKNLLILLFISIVATASAQLKDYSMFDKSLTSTLLTTWDVTATTIKSRLPN